MGLRQLPRCLRCVPLRLFRRQLNERNLSRKQRLRLHGSVHSALDAQKPSSALVLLRIMRLACASVL